MPEHNGSAIVVVDIILTLSFLLSVRKEKVVMEPFPTTPRSVELP